MIKINQSNIYHEDNLVLFQGKEICNSGKFLFKESTLLFGEENLASCLIEYDLNTSLPFNYSSEPLRTSLSNLKHSENHFLNIVDMRIGTFEFDIGIFYENSCFDELSADALRTTLVQRAQFNVEIKDSFFAKCLVENLDTDIVRYIQIAISEKFLEKGGNVLSSHLLSGFDPNRYVDTRVATFLIMSTLSGTTQKIK